MRKEGEISWGLGVRREVGGAEESHVVRLWYSIIGNPF